MNAAFLGGTATAVLVITSYTAWSFARTGPIVGLHQPVRHDDFLFTVNGVRPRQKQLLVEILVVNQAKRVDYHWRDSIAYVQDARGNRYAAVSGGRFTLAPGDSRTATAAFDIPNDARGLTLRFWDGIDMGDALDAATYARSRLELPHAQ